MGMVAESDIPTEDAVAIPLPLSGGGVIWVDRADWEWAVRFRWSRQGTARGYAGRNEERNGRQRLVYLHRQIMDAPTGVHVDHINGDPLDNRRANLRLVTQSENQQNRSPVNPRSRSGHRNVHWSASKQRWIVALRVDRRRITVGRYRSLDDAVATARLARARYMPAASREEMR